MPPETQPRLTPAEIAQFKAWYQQELVDTIAPLPDVLRPRRLSAHEYRQTLRSLFGFDLEVSIAEAEQTVVEKSLVMKLLPVDPPGPSGFKNDTSANPLTTNVWEQYSFLLDDALEQWLSPGNRNRLEVVTGPITSKHMTPEQCEKLLEMDVAPHLPTNSHDRNDSNMRCFDSWQAGTRTRSSPSHGIEVRADVPSFHLPWSTCNS